MRFKMSGPEATPSVVRVCVPGGGGITCTLVDHRQGLPRGEEGGEKKTGAPGHHVPAPPALLREGLAMKGHGMGRWARGPQSTNCGGSGPMPPSLSSTS